MILSFFEKRFLGIDFGSINIKIVEGKKKKDRIEITNFGIIPIINFKEIFSSSYILEENMAAILKDFFKETKMLAKETIFNIPIPYTFSANFLIPNIPEKSLPQIIRFESQKQIPLSFNEVETEYNCLQITTENQEKQWLIFLVAVPQSYLKKLRNISSLLNVKFYKYSSEQFNLEPYFRQKIGNFVVIDIGHSYSTLYFIREGKTVYASKLKVRGYDFLNSIMSLTQYSEDRVLNLVLEKGFLFNPEEKDFKNLAEGFLNGLVSTVNNEIMKLEDNFLLRIDKVYFTGGLCILPGFREEIMKRLTRFQQDILLPSDFVGGEKFTLLKDKSAIFSQAVGVLLKKLLG